MASEVKTNKISPATSTTINVGDSGDTLALAVDDVTGFNVGSDAQGDILYNDGTDYTRLGAGTSGYFLKTQGTSANPVWAEVSTTSDIELLNTYTPTDVATLEITTAAYFASTYSSLIFKCINMQPATDNIHLRIGLGTGVGPTYNSSFTGGFGINQTDGGSVGQWQQDTAYFPAADNFATLFKEVGNGTSENCSGNLEVFNPASTVFEKMYNSFFTGHLYHNYQLCAWSTGRYTETAAITAIKFYFNSGNIANGIIKVYGTR
jgi:hypothetical protein